MPSFPFRITLRLFRAQQFVRKVGRTPHGEAGQRRHQPHHQHQRQVHQHLQQTLQQHHRLDPENHQPSLESVLSDEAVAAAFEMVPLRIGVSNGQICVNTQTSNPSLPLSPSAYLSTCMPNIKKISSPPRVCRKESFPPSPSSPSLCPPNKTHHYTVNVE